MQDQKSTGGNKQGSSDDKFAVNAPVVSLPKGGGAIHGIGEKFAANPVTGTGSMSVPIATSPGRSGFGPQISLSGAFKQTAPKSHRHSWAEMIRRRSIGMLSRGLKTALDVQFLDFGTVRRGQHW